MNTIFTKLLDTADELTDARVHIQRVPYWDANRNKKFREFRTLLPGLLAQLYESAIDPVQVLKEAGRRPKPASRPPLAMEALSRYEDICAAVLRWVRAINMEPRDTPESNIRALVGAAPRFDLDTLEALYAEMRTWRRWAAVMTGWDTHVFRPRIACPVCESWSSIRARLAKDSEGVAYCNECQAYWEGEDLVGMAEKVSAAA